MKKSSKVLICTGITAITYILFCVIVAVTAIETGPNSGFSWISAVIILIAIVIFEPFIEKKISRKIQISRWEFALTFLITATIFSLIIIPIAMTFIQHPNDSRWRIMLYDAFYDGHSFLDGIGLVMIYLTLAAGTLLLVLVRSIIEAIPKFKEKKIAQGIAVSLIPLCVYFLVFWVASAYINAAL